MSKLQTIIVIVLGLLVVSVFCGLGLVVCITMLSSTMGVTGQQLPAPRVMPIATSIPTATPIPTWTPTSTPMPARTRTPTPAPTPTPDPCTFDNPEVRVYLAGGLTALNESGVAMECAMGRGTIGPGIVPCTEQLRTARRNFSALWYPSCADTHRRALLTCLDEEIAALEAGEAYDETAFLAHMERFAGFLDAAKREQYNLEQILKE